jgi:glycosyltransferase A (GT-A) superfamily protein (DUF2064 family)
MTAVTLLVVAKAPIAGFAKTRLTPPLTPTQAARVAAAALLDTLDSARAAAVSHRMVALVGDVGRAECAADIARALSDFDVVPQRGDGFGARLANAHADAARAAQPVLQIGMDTPQAGPRLLSAAARELAADSERAVIGPAADGGWWALGLPSPQAARLLVEVPMSTDRTGECTREVLRRCGHRIRELPTLADADSFADAVGIAEHTSGRFATLVRELHREVAEVQA